MICNKEIPLIGSDNKTIATDVYFIQNQQAKPIVIYLHGFNGFKDWGNFDIIAKQFAENGIFFCKFNFSHNGTTASEPENFVDLEAFGNNSYTKELYDVNCVFDWLHAATNPYQKEFDVNKIVLLGHSRGGGISILAAAQNPKKVKGLITWASVHECKTPWSTWSYEKLLRWQKEGVQYYSNKRTNQLMPLYYQLYEDYQKNKELLNIEKAIKTLQIPILICHGSQDQAVSIHAAEKLHQWANSSTLFILDTDHVFGRKHPNTSNSIPNECQKMVNKSIDFLTKIFF